MPVSGRRHHSRRRAGGGFTLIELLVVIAIIALLVAILAPSLMMCKPMAVRIICATRQRELSKAIFIYAADNDQAFPHAGHTGWWMWDMSVAQRDALGDAGAPRTVFYCPENQDQNLDSLWDFSGFCVTGYYFMFKRDNWGTQQMVGDVFGSIREMGDPASMPLVGDAIISSFSGGDVNDPLNHNFGHAKGGHPIPHKSPHMARDLILPAGGNCVFGDGAVRWHPFGEMTWHKGHTPYHWW